MVIKKQTLDALVVSLVVLASGNPVVHYLLGKELVLIGLPILLCFYGLIRGLRVHKGDIGILCVFALVAIAHYFGFGTSVLPASTGFLLKMLTALLVVRTAANFPQSYVRVMYWLAVISLVAFVPQVLLGDRLRGLAQAIAIPYASDVVHVGFHNFGPEIHAYRNSGFFWEPGAFAGYLVLAIVFSVMGELSKSGRSALSRTTWVLLAALLTTQSTTGYAALLLFAVAFVHVRYGRRYSGRLAFSMVALLSAGFAAYVSMPFLAEKIDSQFEASMNRDERSEITRFGNAMYDWEFIRKRPLLGWSPMEETRAVVDAGVSDLVAGQGNGLTGLVVRFGFAGLLIYVVLSYRFFLRYSGHSGFAMAAVAVVLVLLIGEQFLNFPLFMTLMFGPGRLRRKRAAASFDAHIHLPAGACARVAE